MKSVLVLVTLVLLSSYAFGQKTAREQKVQTIIDLRSQITALEKEVMLPESSDVDASEQIGASAIRLLPREKYDRVLAINGGGSYYSFVRKTHEYGFGSDIELQQNQLSVGFAGRDYGFFIDLGIAPLAGDIKDLKNIRGLDFLVDYKPSEHPRAESQTRSSEGYKINELVYKNRVPAVVGHTYALRSIGLPESDIVVAFTIRRKDEDGSLIIFWRLIEDFSRSADKSVAKAPTR